MEVVSNKNKNVWIDSAVCDGKLIPQKIIISLFKTEFKKLITSLCKHNLNAWNMFTTKVLFKSKFF